MTFEFSYVGLILQSGGRRKWSGWSDALRREEGARSQEAQVPLETGEGTEADSPLQPPEEVQPSQHQGFSVLASRTGREEICVCVPFLSH